MQRSNLHRCSATNETILARQFSPGVVRPHNTSVVTTFTQEAKDGHDRTHHIIRTIMLLRAYVQYERSAADWVATAPEHRSASATAACSIIVGNY